MHVNRAIPSSMQHLIGRVYRLPDRWRIPLFWLLFVWETITSRRLSPLVRLRLGAAGLPHAEGLKHLPRSGTYCLASNHFKGRHSVDTLAAVLAATSRPRSDMLERCLLIVGKRNRHTPDSFPLQARIARRLIAALFRRWHANVLRIPLGNDGASIAALREWRRRAQHQSCLVFPEGRAQRVFGAIRPGAGRWLATLGVPVLPVAVWWQDGAWQVRIGPQIQWTKRTALRDAQLGLAIAALLPSQLQAAWQPSLARWREAHEATAPCPVSGPQVPLSYYDSHTCD